jgi:hypothetical protein
MNSKKTSKQLKKGKKMEHTKSLTFTRKLDKCSPF